MFGGSNEEEDYIFESKPVIVMLASMDYDCIATAHRLACRWNGHGRVYTYGVQATQMAAFLHNMGYQAVGAGNDLGSSVPYAIMAELGEGGRATRTGNPAAKHRPVYKAIFANSGDT